MSGSGHRLFSRHTIRLAATYLAIIMILSLGFSAVFFKTSSNQLGRQIPPDDSGRHHSDAPLPHDYDDELNNFLQERISEGRHELLVRLIGLNAVALVVGGGLSLLLARRTLQPIEDAMEAQAQFVSDASHELRTPLTALRTSNEVALRRAEITEKDAREIIAYNVEESVRLKDLSDALLGLLKEDTAINDLVHLNDVIEAAVQQVRPASDAKHITLQAAATDATVYGSRQALTQVLTILLDNAIKYSDDKGKVQVEVDRSGKRHIVRVSDTGIGIGPEDLPRVFERFYRSDKARSRGPQSGFGLGLAIAQKIAQRHRGAITVESTPGKGTVFSLSIPVA